MFRQYGDLLGHVFIFRLRSETVVGEVKKKDGIQPWFSETRSAWGQWLKMCNKGSDKRFMFWSIFRDRGDSNLNPDTKCENHSDSGKSKNTPFSLHTWHIKTEESTI